MALLESLRDNGAAGKEHIMIHINASLRLIPRLAGGNIQRQRQEVREIARLLRMMGIKSTFFPTPRHLGETVPLLSSASGPDLDPTQTQTIDALQFAEQIDLTIVRLIQYHLNQLHGVYATPFERLTALA
jgi:hypothetical protein